MEFKTRNKLLDEIAKGTGTHDIVAGLDPDRFAVFKFGTNPEVDTLADEDVWSVGGQLQYLASPETVSFVSDNAADTMDIVITGVGTDYALQNETITLNGLTPVITTNVWLRIWRVELADTPGGPVNAGVITGTASAAATVQAQIEAGEGQTQMSQFTVPAGYTGFIYSLFGSTSPTDTALVRIKSSINGGPFKIGGELEISGDFTATYFSNLPLSLPEKTDFKFEAKSLTQNTRVTGSYRILLVKNTAL